MIRAGLIGVAALVAGCVGADETLSAYGAADRVWVLETLDDAPFPARATLEFPQPGRLAGQAPCNSYFGAQTAPYPWFSVEVIGASRRACPDLELEAAYFTSLTEMTIAEVSGDVLILSNDAGRSLVFRAAP